jgi:hypothetical protein
VQAPANGGSFLPPPATRATRQALGGSPPAVRFATARTAFIQNKRATILVPLLPANGR